MNIDHVLQTMNQWQVAYVLIGGMNFLLRHEPILTYDIDLWIDDTDLNRSRCEAALAALDAEWGETDATWEPVRSKPPGWLSRQSVFSMNSPHGAIDIFRFVPGLPDWQMSRQNSVVEQTSRGVSYYGISDDDMLRCQMALDASARKASRVQALQDKLKQKP
jgi:hypothetical protein